MNKIVQGFIIFIIGLSLGYILPKSSSPDAQDEMMWSQSSQFGVMLNYIAMQPNEQESSEADFNQFLQNQANSFINYSKKTENEILSNWLLKKTELVDKYLTKVNK